MLAISVLSTHNHLWHPRYIIEVYNDMHMHTSYAHARIPPNAVTSGYIALVREFVFAKDYFITFSDIP